MMCRRSSKRRARIGQRSRAALRKPAGALWEEAPTEEEIAATAQIWRNVIFHKFMNSARRRISRKLTKT
jgi:hypothetical protein